jgi:hypothetical protein
MGIFEIDKRKMQEGLYFKEQHEYVVELFALDDAAFGEGTWRDFKIKACALLIGLYLLRFMLGFRMPSWIDVAAIGVACVLLVEAVARVAVSFNDDSRKSAFTGILKHLFLLGLIIVAVGYAG